MQHTEHLLPFPKAIRFFRAIRDEDSFTILWELAANSPEPVPFEGMRKTFGADPRYLLEVLSRLQHLGLATKAGQHWTVCKWAKASLDYVEELMKDVEIEVAQPVSPAMAIYANEALEVATHDGFWSASASQVTPSGHKVSGEAQAASPTETLDIGSPEDVNRAQNEARNHDYK